MGLQHFPSLKCAPWAHFHGNTSVFPLDTVAKPMGGKKLWHSPSSSRALRNVAMATRGTESREHPDSLTSHGQVKMSNGRIGSHQTRIYCYIHVTLTNISIRAKFEEKQRQLELPLLVLLTPAKIPSLSLEGFSHHHVSYWETAPQSGSSFTVTFIHGQLTHFFLCQTSPVP